MFQPDELVQAQETHQNAIEHRLRTNSDRIATWQAKRFERESLRKRKAMLGRCPSLHARLQRRHLPEHLHPTCEPPALLPPHFRFPTASSSPPSVFLMRLAWASATPTHQITNSSGASFATECAEISASVPKPASTWRKQSTWPTGTSRRSDMSSRAKCMEEVCLKYGLFQRATRVGVRRI